MVRAAPATKAEKARKIHIPSGGGLLQDRAVLVHLKVSCMELQIKDKRGAKSLKDDFGADESMVSGLKTLFKSEDFDNYRKTYWEMRTIHLNMTSPWLDGGIRILPTAFYDDYQTKEQALKQDADMYVKRLAKSYDTIKMQSKEFLGSLYEEKDWPSKEAFGRKFGVSIRFMPIPRAEDFRLNHGAESLLDELADSVKLDVWTRIAAMMERVKNALGGDGKVTKKMIADLRELSDLLPGLNITGDPKVQKVANDIQQSFKNVVDQDSLKDKDLRAQSLEAATKFSDAAAGFLKAFED